MSISFASSTRLRKLNGAGSTWDFKGDPFRLTPDAFQKSMEGHDGGEGTQQTGHTASAYHIPLSYRLSGAGLGTALIGTSVAKR